MKRPCGGCDRYRPGQSYDIKRDCRICFLYYTRPEYRKVWAEPEPVITPSVSSVSSVSSVPAVPAVPSAPLSVSRFDYVKCQYRGEVIEPSKSCGQCHIYSCQLHYRCKIIQIGTERLEVRSCAECPDAKRAAT